jgi:hypothetical protein
MHRVHLTFSAADVKRIFENDFSKKMKRVSKIHNLLILAPKIVKQIV